MQRDEASMLIDIGIDILEANEGGGERRCREACTKLTIQRLMTILRMGMGKARVLLFSESFFFVYSIDE